jgi:dethiobiotin synthetase
MEERHLEADRLAGYCREVMGAGAEFVLVEGAGGWRVPINDRETLADVAVQLGVGVILVVGMRLGCINHALLTAEAIRRDGLHLAGWVANQPGKRMAHHAENLDTLRRLLLAPLLGDVPRMPAGDRLQMAAHLDIRPLLTPIQ